MIRRRRKWAGPLPAHKRNATVRAARTGAVMKSMSENVLEDYETEAMPPSHGWYSVVIYVNQVFTSAPVWELQYVTLLARVQYG